MDTMIKKPRQYRSKKIKTKQYKRPGQMSARQKGYDSKWEKYRHRFLYHNPVCYTCPDKAKHVDHIKRASDGKEYFKHLHNHLPLCHSCHSKVTMLFDIGPVQDLDGKLAWIQKRREELNLKHKVYVLKNYE